MEVAVGAPACSSSGRSPATDAIDAADAADSADAAAVDAADDSDSSTSQALSCQGIRLCMAAGSTAETCAMRATTLAQSTFQALLDCLNMHCAGLATACVCQEECLQPDGYCLDETEACLAASGSNVDAICDQYCAG
jgi:hypothetical protein